MSTSPVCSRQPPPELEACVHDLFREHAQAQPFAEAVSAHDAVLTYGELDQASERVALLLRQNGITKEVPVGLYFQKSAWAIVAMLGVMKAGGTCVNLSPAYPDERIRTILAACDAKIVLSNTLQNGTFGQTSVKTFLINNETVSEFRDPGQTMQHADPSSAAYILFTSGSTGEPKGTVVEHGSLATSLRAYGERWKVNRASRIFQFASYTFG